jgi:hypothetical protein
MKLFRRPSRRSLLLAFLLAALAFGAARLCLASQRVARQAAARLEQLLGASVRVGSARIGLFGESVLRSVELSDDEGPFLTIDEVRADLSVWGLLRGAEPGTVRLRGAHLVLRFDRAGQLLTQLPAASSGQGALPRLLLESGEVTLAQQGRPPLTLHNIHAELNPNEVGADLRGGFNDPEWGEWTISGSLALADRKGTLTLASSALQATPARLQALPFVPPAIWQQVRVDGTVPLELTLGFAADDPTFTYRVAFERARLTLPQPDRLPLVVASARAVLEGDDEGLTLDGSLSDPYWGQWILQAGLCSRTGAITLRLHTPDVSVDPAKLRALPYVPKNVWQQVEAAGRTSADVRVGMFTDRPEVHYRVELEPRDTKVRVTALDLEADEAQGGVVIEDGLVLLRRVRGRVAGGTLVTSGELDFRRPVSRLRFQVAVRRLGLSRLPARWSVPAQIDGLLTGKADLAVTVRNGETDTRGRGTGVVANATLVGFQTRLPIGLQLFVEGKRVRYQLERAPRVSQAEPPELWGPVGLLARLPDGAGYLADRVSEGTAWVLQALVRAGRPGRPGGTPTYLGAEIALDDIDLAQLVRRLDLNLPFAVAGQATVKLRLDVPVNSPGRLRAYRLRGTAVLPRLVLGELELTGVAAHVEYADGVLHLRQLSGQVFPAGRGGTFRGSARLGVVPLGELHTEVRLETISLGQALSLLPGAETAECTLSGEVRLKAPVKRLTDPAQWQGTAALSSSRFHLAGSAGRVALTLRDTAARLNISGGTAVLTDLRGRLDGGTLTGSGSLRLAGAFPYQARIALAGIDLGRPEGLPGGWRSPIPLRGTVRLDAAVRGGLAGPTALGASGTVRGTGVRVAGVPVEEVSCAWGLKDGCVQLTEIVARISGGKVVGSVVVPLRGSKPGEAELRLRGGGARALAQALPLRRLRVEGHISGRLRGRLTEGGDGQGRALEAEAEVRAAHIQVEGIRTQRLHGRLAYRHGQASYQMEGDGLGGRFRVEGKVPLFSGDPGSAVAEVRQGQGQRQRKPAGHLRVERVGLSRVVEALQLQDRLGRLRGVMSFDLPFDHDARTGWPVGRGRFEVRDVRWQDSELSDGLAGELRVSPGTIRLRDVSGVLGGGVLRLYVTYSPRQPGRNTFSLSLSHAEASKLLVFPPGGLSEHAELVQGAVDVSLRGTLGSEWRGAGAVALSRGKVLGVDVQEWRIPLDFSLVPGRGYGELSLRDSGGQVGGGRALAGGTLTWGGNGLRVEGHLRLIDAELRHLAGMLGDVSSYAQGRVSGRVDLSGDNVRSLHDLQATIGATFQQAQVLQMPVLRQLSPYLLPSQASAAFKSGELKARLAGGVLRVERLALVSNVIQLLMPGTITLDGRLDLEAYVRTNFFGPDPLWVRLAQVRLPPVGPIPVSLLLQITGYLSNKVVKLRVTGSVRNPVVRAEPVRLLTEQAVRFFIGQALVP